MRASQSAEISEQQFTALVDSLGCDASRRDELTELLREDSPFYKDRGTATTVRMRGWVFHTLSCVGLTDAGLLFALGELDTAAHPYLVAAAARALRSYPAPNAAFSPFVMRALTSIRIHDEPVSFACYDDYGAPSSATTAVRELLATLVWLGPHGRAVVRELETLRAQRGSFSRKLLGEVEEAITALRGGEQIENASCCVLQHPGRYWSSDSRPGTAQVGQTVFEDQDGAVVTFREFFQERPTIVVFFYTRCDNPLKCSLTITKLARLQTLLEAQGLRDQVQTAAITYDPAFDVPQRLRGYAVNRGLSLDGRHRMLRTRDGLDPLRRHFDLGVNFTGSLVNAHRLELYVLDREGRIASSFERLQWGEQQVVDRAIKVLHESPSTPGSTPVLRGGMAPPGRTRVLSMMGAVAPIAYAFFPKCPVCWATYLSMAGVAGLERVPYSPWLQPLLFAGILVNLGSVWMRARSALRSTAFGLVTAGALAIIVSRVSGSSASVAILGVVLTIVGSLLSTAATTRRASL